MSITETLPEHQRNLVKKYLLSNIFKGCVDDINDARKSLKEARNMSQIKLDDYGKFICIYGGLFGLGSKIKALSFFSEDTFYYKDTQITQAIIVPYTKIQQVAYAKGDKSGVLLFDNYKRLTLPKKIIAALKGIEIIRKGSFNSCEMLGEYILSHEEKILGEYLTFSVMDLFKDYFPKRDLFDWIPCRCSITELSLKKIEIRITVTDKDYDYHTPEEWENAIKIFSSREDILNKIKQELSTRLCLDYSFEQIVFTSRFRKSISKAISNGMNTVSNITSTVCDKVETTAYYEAAQSSKLKADIITKTQGTDNDEYAENIEKYHQYKEAYQERTKLPDNEEGDDLY